MHVHVRCTRRVTGRERMTITITPRARPARPRSTPSRPSHDSPRVRASRACRWSTSWRRSPPSTSHLWRPPRHPTQRTRAEALARLALSSRREARVPHALARRGSPGYARARATTLGCEQLPLLGRARGVGEPPGGDVGERSRRACAPRARRGTTRSPAHARCYRPPESCARTDFA